MSRNRHRGTVDLLAQMFNYRLQTMLMGQGQPLDFARQRSEVGGWIVFKISCKIRPVARRKGKEWCWQLSQVEL